MQQRQVEQECTRAFRKRCRKLSINARLLVSPLRRLCMLCVLCVLCCSHHFHFLCWTKEQRKDLLRSCSFSFRTFSAYLIETRTSIIQDLGRSRRAGDARVCVQSGCKVTSTHTDRRSAGADTSSRRWTRCSWTRLRRSRR